MIPKRPGKKKKKRTEQNKIKQKDHKSVKQILKQSSKYKKPKPKTKKKKKKREKRGDGGGEEVIV